jgi:hypothetical protein
MADDVVPHGASFESSIGPANEGRQVDIGGVPKVSDATLPCGLQQNRMPGIAYY